MKVHPLTPPIWVTVDLSSEEVTILRTIGGIGATASRLIQKECGWSDKERETVAEFFRDMFYSLPNLGRKGA